MQTLLTWRQVSMLLLGVVAGVFVFQSGVMTLAAIATPPAPVSLSSSATVPTRVTEVLPLTVSGEVRAADSITVRARTAGLVESVLVSAGMPVSADQLAVVQTSPELAAAVARGRAGEQVVVAERALVDAAQASEFTISSVQAAGSADLLTLTTTANSAARDTATAALHTAINQAVEVAVASAALIDENPSAFTIDGLRVYRTAIGTLYGRVPNYLTSIQYAQTYPSTLKDALAALPDTTSPAILHTVSVELGTVLEGLHQALVLAERRVLDPQDYTSAAGFSTDYFAQRRALREAQGSLAAAAATLLETSARTAPARSTAETNAMVTAELAVLAERQARLTSAATEAARAAAAADTAAAAARASLLETRAGVTGVVGGPVVRPGTYVVAGEPLFALHGDGAREVSLQVPVQLSSWLRVGQPLRVDGIVVGEVDRWSPAMGGVVSVIVRLTDSSVPTGVFLTGELELSVPPAWYSVPKAAVFFTSAGAAVRSDENVFPVQAQMVVGDVWYVQSDTALPATVALPTGIQFE